ncbi:MAG: polymer-forming cytoskeletal protein [Deltaproteobacteria bacterium]|nr:polymer-forming cytoskeletal protein [Deltaproteobacteria bacterium]
MATGGTGVIGRGITIRGNLSGSEDLIIEGRVEGTVSLKNHLTIESTGVVVADVDAANLTVNGEVNGNIGASECVIVSGSAKVVGNIRAPRVIIEDGARFKGGIDMEFDLPEGVSPKGRR